MSDKNDKQKGQKTIDVVDPPPTHGYYGFNKKPSYLSNYDSSIERTNQN